MSKVCLVAGLGLALIGCGDEEEAPMPEQPSALEAEATNEVEPEPEEQVTDDAPAPPEEQVPVAEDFEAASEREITTDNYEAELDRIERELGGDSVQTDAHGH